MLANGLQATYSLKTCLTLNKPGSCLFRGLRDLKPGFYRSDRSDCFWVSYTEEILPTWLLKWLLFSCTEPTWKLLDQTSELHSLVCVSGSSQKQMSQRRMQYLKEIFIRNSSGITWSWQDELCYSLHLFFKITNIAIILCCLKILAHNRIQWWYISKGHMLFYTIDVLCLTFMEEEASMQPLHWFGPILPPLPGGDVFVVFQPPRDTKQQLHWTRCLWKTHCWCRETIVEKFRLTLNLTAIKSTHLFCNHPPGLCLGLFVPPKSMLTPFFSSFF